MNNYKVTLYFNNPKHYERYISELSYIENAQTAKEAKEKAILKYGQNNQVIDIKARRK